MEITLRDFLDFWVGPLSMIGLLIICDIWWWFLQKKEKAKNENRKQ
jgi:plastocyanin domain-containing protein